ncbi:MAG: YwiC-like family protein [Actinomyces urogenitalis]|uniref:YwiC-like family protein n=1 Tax=Actinomyces urogenitalis TaxID=103621 RepID=UPI000A4950D8|nr:YwiC-like family protein [Actinomyces urogenitalis]MBS6071998.1 YwiC-like family protein [Actinomyces urogenitalis]MDU0863925.1 YwiC-like family protein [Actinomyces urogenitalis]MDU0874652.1 YwiC-like family protein [Actinomyces urogenitalis]MDU1564310.1 YwiC-like family protein [Actinomyces urogenitalis]MDU1639626.1 YwiC-like family protein [Actinomyces urogenitalis]
MTQQRPSRPHEYNGAASPAPEEVLADEQPAEQAEDGRRPSPIPSHQSRPGPEDDIMLATGRPRGAGEPTPVRERVEAAKERQEQIRRQPGRKAWIPNQHGAWSMLVLPPLVGWVVGGVSWKNLLLLPAWWSAYLTYWAWSQWLRTRSPRRRALILVPLLAYTAATAMLGLITLAAAPYLLQFAVPLAPLFAIALWEVWSGRERSLLSGLSTTAAASIMAAVTYSLAVGGAGGFLGTGATSSPLPGSSPNGELVGWSWMWVVTALTAAYFCGTVPYIKAMIRERFNNRLLAGTVAWHAAVALLTLVGAGTGYLPWAHAALWVLLAVRSFAMVRWQWSLVRRTHKGLRPGTMGVVELAFCLAFLITIAS